LWSNVSRRTARQVSHSALHLFLIILGLSFMVPFFWVAATSLKVPGQVFTYPIQWIPRYPQWQNYRTIFDLVQVEGGNPAIPLWFRNTLMYVVLGTLGSIVSSAVVAFGLTRLKWRGQGVVFAMTLVSMMLPGVVTMVPTFLIFRDLGWINTYLPLLIPTWMAGNAFYIFLLRQFFSTLPVELDEAAIMDGASSFRILWQVIMPLAKPALAAVGIFSFLGTYNDFMGPLIYISSLDKYPISVGLRFVAGHYGNRWPDVMVLVMMSLLPVIVLFFLAQKTFVQGVQMSGIAGR
jgi:multiple sugar transport system permease protein